MKRKRRADESPPKKGHAPRSATVGAQEDRAKSSKYADENKGWQRVIAIRHLAEIARQLQRLADQCDAELWSKS
jgi:hypothetical protein